MDCTKITLECPVEDTTYGYYPSLTGNAIFTVLFAICALGQITLGVVYRVKLYSILVFLGCIGEVVGYIGRIMLHSNPWNNAGFIMQVLLLIVSPSFLAAALYLTLKQFVLYYGPEFSKLRPALYTLLFITCDAIGFFAQLVGGGISSSAGDGKGSLETVKLGNDVMIAGISFQAGTMAVAGILAIDFAQRAYRHRQRDNSRQSSSSKRSNSFEFYLCCTITAFVTILIRCIYR
jgi:hypothetical protein